MQVAAAVLPSWVAFCWLVFVFSCSVVAWFAGAVGFVLCFPLFGVLCLLASQPIKILQFKKNKIGSLDGNVASNIMHMQLCGFLPGVFKCFCLVCLIVFLPGIFNCYLSGAFNCFCLVCLIVLCLVCLIVICLVYLNVFVWCV